MVRSLFSVLLLASCSIPQTEDRLASSRSRLLARSALPLYDAHLHRMPGDAPADLLAFAQQAGFTGIAVAGPASGLPVQSLDPTYVSAFYFVQDADVLNPTMPATVEQAILNGARGVGELSIRHFPAGGEPAVDHPADDPVLLDLYGRLAELGVPLLVHMDWEDGRMAAFETALAHDRRLRFVWAHSGDAQPDDVRSMLDAHSNLYADLSCRHPYYPRWNFTPEEQSIALVDEVTLKEEWRSLFEDHPDRFLWGSDVGPDSRAQEIDKVTGFTQAMLWQLSLGTARGIASDNAAVAYGL